MEEREHSIHLRTAMKRHSYLSQKDVTMGVDQFQSELNALMAYDFPVSVFEKAFELKKAELRSLENETIPNILQTDFAGVTSLEFGDKVLKLKQHLGVKVTDEEALIGVLKDEGYENKIKKTFDFDKGLDLEWLEKEVRSRGLVEKEQVKIKEGIHYKSRDIAIEQILSKYEGQEAKDVFGDCVDISYFNTVEIKEKQ